MFFGVSVRVLTEVIKPWIRKEDKRDKENTIIPLISSIFLAIICGFQFNLFNYFHFNPPIVGGMLITILVITEISYDSHNFFEKIKNILLRHKEY